MPLGSPSALFIGPDACPSLGLAAGFLFAPGLKGRDNERPWRRRFSRTAPARALPRCASLVPRLRLPDPRRRPLPLAGPVCRPRQAVGEPSWGGSPSPVAPAPLDVSSILAADRTGSPQGPGARSCVLSAARRPPPLGPRAAAATEQTGPAPRALGEGAGIGGDTPSEAGGGRFHTHSALGRKSDPSPSHPPELSPWLPTIYFCGPWRRALRAKRYLQSLHKEKRF